MAPTPNPFTETPMDRLATHCIAARTIIEENGTPVMRRLIDLLLFEIGVALAEPTEAPHSALETAR